MKMKDFFAKHNRGQDNGLDDLDMGYEGFYSGKSEKPVERAESGAEPRRDGGYYDVPDRTKGGYVEPDFHSDNSRYYDTPVERPVERVEANGDSIVRPREVYNEPETAPRPAESVFTPAPAPEYLFYTPSDYRECRESIARGLADGNIVVVRLGKLGSEDVLRLFDYMMGAVAALDADYSRPQLTTVVLSPKGIEPDEEELISALTEDDDSEEDEDDRDGEYDEDYDEDESDEEYDGYDDEYEEDAFDEYDEEDIDEDVE